eukprot:TRINITY_DN667_c0_g1_i1.p1 TRINITY_DN667_c0_g1~~TRINITY_DN667_c0_g1_i1.p1  ORF type:complete len:1526 (+),score=218.47 TRINITY_DN667_c0_g1_i1:80-4579(+)
MFGSERSQHATERQACRKRVQACTRNSAHPKVSRVIGALLLIIHGAVATAPSTGNKSTGTCAPNLIQQRAGLARSHLNSVSMNCAFDSHCTVPAGETWILDSSVRYATITIRGTLEWDTSQDGLELRAGHVLVESGGHLKIGTQAAPMQKRATVYITKNSHTHQDLGKRFFGGVGSGRVDVHGRKLERTWTLLSSNGFPGQNVLQLKDDPTSMGWEVGDRIGVATTSSGESTVHRVVARGQNSVTLDTPLKHEHWGGFREIEGHRFEMAAEVVNLERSVVITGDHDDFEQSLEGLHVIMTGTGYMDMRYARVEWCGQRPIMGRYCLHFHLMRQCPKCAFQGNAVVEGQHVGITIHGTHQTLVDQNVVWDARANGLYTEDGNEMDNTLSRNVMICTNYRKCKVDWVSGLATQTAGIFLIGMSNNIVENRIVQYENGIWTPGSFRADGRGAAVGKVCPQFHPFGEWRGNVCHDNARFGLYLDNQYPRNLQRDVDGYVLHNRESCKWFTADGRDNGVVNEVRDEFNWHNPFVGQYAIGDIQFINYTSINNGHALYWKQGKNFVDGRKWHILDSTFAHDPSDKYGVLQLLGPSGPFTFGMKNVKFLGGGPPGIATVAAGQNCGQGGGAGPCNVQYLFENVDFSRMRANQKFIKFGAHTRGGQAAVQSIFLAKDDSLGGYRSIVSGHLNGFESYGCVKLDWKWEDALGCDRPVRRLNIWGSDFGRIKLDGPGFQVGENGAFPVEGRNAGFLSWDNYHEGYGSPVLAGQTYTLSGNFWSDAIVEFSDDELGDYFSATESVNLAVGGRTCQLKSSDDRSFICPMGRDGGGGANVLTGGCSFITFDRHTVIREGRLECSDPDAARPTSPAPPPPPAPAPPPPAPVPLPSLPAGSCMNFDVWPNVDGITCQGCTALVLTSPYGGRCDTYCESFGHVCIAAFEEENEDCQVKFPAECNQEVGGTSDMLCTCSLPEAATTSTTTITSAVSTSIVTSTSMSPSPPSGPLGSCSPFSIWPDVDNGISCDDCTALVFTGPYSGRCDVYCESFGHVCVFAAEEEAENCQVKYSVGCDEDVADTSDMLCTCKLPDEVKTTETTSQAAISSSSTSSTQEGTSQTTPDPGQSFHLVGGESGRACRGATASDNLASYYKLFFGMPLIEECKAKCMAEPSCTGIEHHSSGRCEVWTRPEGIQASIALDGYTCLAYGESITTTPFVSPLPFVPVDGGEGRACRGAAANDNLASYYTIFSGVPLLQECKAKCMAEPLCTGIEHKTSGRCEVWTRPEGIQASIALDGYTCLAYGESITTTPFVSPLPFVPVDGGEGRACRGAAANDNLASYYIIFSGMPLLQECKARCVAEPSCTGIEHHSSGRCEVWTRLEGIQASIPLDGYTCLAIGTASSSTLALSTTLSSTKSSSTSAATTSKATSDIWELRTGTNCYSGFGATSLSELAGTWTVAGCQAQCMQEPACEAVVMRSGFQDGTSPCWLVGDVNIEQCQSYPDYDVWYRVR